MVSLNVQMETLVVNFPQGDGAAVHFLRLSAAVTEFIVVQVGPPVISQRELVTETQIKHFFLKKHKYG